MAAFPFWVAAFDFPEGAVTTAVDPKLVRLVGLPLHRPLLVNAPGKIIRNSPDTDGCLEPSHSTGKKRSGTAMWHARCE